MSTMIYFSIEDYLASVGREVKKAMTLDEMRDALEKISHDCLTTALDLKGEDAAVVSSLLREISHHAEQARAKVLQLMRRDS